MRRLTLVLLAVTLCASRLAAQDPAKIIDASVKAAGGAKLLRATQSLRIEGVVASSRSSESGAFTFLAKLPNRYYREFTFKSDSFIEAYNGKSAWSLTGSEAPRTLLGVAGLRIEAAARYYNSHLLDYKKDKLGLRYAGTAQINGRPALQIEVVWPAGVKRVVSFDAETHLILQETTRLDPDFEEITFDGYRNESGLMIAHRFTYHTAAGTFTVTVTRVERNGAAGERTFDFPRRSQVQLPDLKALFKEIDDNQKAVDKIKENYAGTREEEETEYDKTGKVTKRETREYTFFYLSGQEVPTLTKKNGKPLGGDESKKENERAQKRVAELQKQQTKKEAREEKARREGKDEDDEPGIEVFLRACQFVNPRRERFRGQDVLVFDFEPNPDFKPRNRKESLAQKLAGVVWVDEQARQVVRLEAYFTGDFKIGGGILANLQKGTSFVFEQAFINNEVWLPTYGEAHVGVRVLLVKGFKINVVERYSDYQRFNVETLNTIGKPKEAEATPTKP